MNIIFLTAATGGGHEKAAIALMQYMEKQISGCKTILIDTLKFINPLIDRLVTGTYLSTIRKIPSIYGKLYDFSEREEFITLLVKGVNGIFSHKLYKIFEQYSPDAVVCTHTIPLQMLSSLKKKGLVSIPVVGVVTDFSNHFFWKLEGPDALIVAHDRIKKDMVKMGLPEEIIHSCGIPVAECFISSHTNRAQILERMGLDDKPTLLLMGGSMGYGNMLKIFSELISIRREIQIIAVTGSNIKLKCQLESISQNTNKKVAILGYSDNISELMDASSLLITKPGGVTISEALVKKLPILIISPIPGQEERNARFLINSGASIMINQCDDIKNILESTLDSPSVLKHMTKAADILAKPNACKDICSLIEELIRKENVLCCSSQAN